MSILSDYQRHVSGPLEDSLRATVVSLRARVAELEGQLEAKPARVEITEEMVERAARAFNAWAVDFQGHNAYAAGQREKAFDSARTILTAALSGDA